MKQANKLKAEALLESIKFIGTELKSNEVCSIDDLYSSGIDASKYENIASAEVLYQYFTKKSDAIDLSNHDRLKLPKELEQCTNIKILNISNNSFYNKKEIDIDFSKLTKLKTLNLSCCNLYGFDCKLKGFENLFELNLLGVKFHRYIPLAIELIATMVKKLSITIDDFFGADFTFLEHCSQLEFLEIHNFDMFIDLSKLVNLKTLTIDSYINTGLNYSILSMVKLEKLSISNAPNLTELPCELANLPNLKSIHIADSRIKDVPETLKNSPIKIVIERDVVDQTEVFNVSINSKKTKAKKHRHCNITSEIVKYQHKVLKTKSIDLSYFGNLGMPKELEYCSDIESLNLSSRTFSDTTIDLRRNRKLKFIDLSYCEMFYTKFNIEGLDQLDKIDLTNTLWCNTNIDEIIKIPKKLLISVNVDKNSWWSNDFSIESCTQLEHLIINYLNQQTDFSQLSKLKVLKIDHFNSYFFNDTFLNLISLVELVINNMPHLTEIPSEFATLPNLESIHISNSKIKEIPKELRDSQIKIVIN